MLKRVVMIKITYLSSLQNALHEAFGKDPKLFLLGEDILDPYGGAFKVTEGLSSKFPERVIPTPICEASIVGAAIGLALRGMRSISEMMFGDFVLLAADQIVNQAIKFEMITAGKIKIPIVIRTPTGGGRGYGPVHSQSLEKMFMGVPGLQVVAPSHYHNPGDTLLTAIKTDRPVLFIENKLLYPKKLVLGAAIAEDRGYPLVVVKNFEDDRPPDVVVVTYGGISRLLEELLVEMAKEEIRITGVLPSLIAPMSISILKLISDIVKSCGRVIVAEEGYEGFGWGSEVAKCIYENIFHKLSAPIKCIGCYQSVIPSSFELEKEVIVTKTKMEEAIMEVLSI